MTRRFTRLAWAAAACTYLLIVLGAVVVKLALPPWTVILHLGTAMLLLATLLVIATQASRTPGASPGPTGAPSVPLGVTPGLRPLPLSPGFRPGLVILALGFIT